MTLSEHTVKSYDKDLQAIAETIDEMCQLVLQSIDIVALAIRNSQEDFLDRIITHDYKINSLDFLIERKVTSMLALRQPMAVDLRYIVSALKVSSNLERMGDQAKSVVKKMERIRQSKIEDGVEKVLFEMLDVSKNMVIKSVQAFNEQDAKKAEEVLQEDEMVDENYEKLFKIVDEETLSREKVVNIINILFIAKNFERLADHTTNIAEITKYVITGETK